MASYIEYRLSEKGSEHQGQWLEFASHEAKSRRQVMKTLAKSDKENGLGNVQRKVRPA